MKKQHLAWIGATTIAMLLVAGMILLNLGDSSTEVEETEIKGKPPRAEAAPTNPSNQDLTTSDQANKPPIGPPSLAPVQTEPAAPLPIPVILPQMPEVPPPMPMAPPPMPVMDETPSVPELVRPMDGGMPYDANTQGKKKASR